MRTVKLAVQTRVDVSTEVLVETEVVVDEGDDAEERGAEAMRFVNAFTAGMAREAQG